MGGLLCKLPFSFRIRRKIILFNVTLHAKSEGYTVDQNEREVGSSSENCRLIERRKNKDGIKESEPVYHQLVIY